MIELDEPLWRVLRRDAVAESWRLRWAFAGPADPGWRDQAACVGLPTSVFYEQPTQSMCIELCRTCPALHDCARDCLDVERQLPLFAVSVGGVRAGMLAVERVRFFRAHPYLRDLGGAECGTDSGYNRHRNAGEDPCARCLDAHARAKVGRSMWRRSQSRHTSELVGV